MILLVALLAFYLAWNLGANDVANSMGTSVGSKAVTLHQALIIAGILEFTGAVLFGGTVSETLATDIVNPVLFAATPNILVLGMISVLIACGLWMQIATSLGLPVSSSHAVVGAIAGFSWVAAGFRAVDWSSIGTITMAWILTPLVSGAIAAFFYSIVKRYILDPSDSIVRLQEWIPWLSAAFFGIFGIIVLPTLTRPLQLFLIDNWGMDIPSQDLPIAVGAIASITVSFFSWRQLDNIQKIQNPKSKIQNPIEKLLGRFQVLSACCVAFAHGSNDVGNAIAPLAAIAYINRTGNVPLEDFTVPLWILVLGGLGIVAGLAVWGKNVISTVGENIIPLKPSGGFCAELATATTVLIASRLGLPVSTSHALVGGVVGIGIVQSFRSIQFGTIQAIGGAWITTIPFTAVLAAGIFSVFRMIGIG
jgi:inorganic phosphate transporter, PiT family